MINELLSSSTNRGYRHQHRSRCTDLGHNRGTHEQCQMLQADAGSPCRIAAEQLTGRRCLKRRRLGAECEEVGASLSAAQRSADDLPDVVDAGCADQQPARRIYARRRNGP
jgi:hypothetical protein